MITFLSLLAFWFATELPVNESDSTEAELFVRADDFLYQLQQDFVSTDRLSFTFNTGEYGYFGPQPTFLIDGLPIEPGFFGVINSRHLPFVSGTITNIYYNQTTGTNRSNRITPPVIIETRFVEDGIAVFGSTQISNETGETGPWAYDPDKVTPNKERFGPGIDLELSFGRDGFYGKTQLRYHRHLNTNLSVQGRMKTIVSLPEERKWLQARAISMSGMAMAGYKNNRLNIRGRLMRAESDEFLFFQPLGREIPAKPTLDQSIVAADVKLAENWAYSGNAQILTKQIGYRENRFVHEFDWQEQTNSLCHQVRYQSEKYRVEGGSRFRSINTTAPAITNETRRYLDLTAFVQLQLSRDLTMESDHQITFHSSEPASQSGISLAYQFHKNWETGIGFTYSEQLPEFANPVADLVNRGYDIENRFGIPHSIPESFGKNRMLKFSLNQNFSVTENLNLSAGINHILHRSMHIPFQPVQYNAVLHTTPGTYRLYDEQNGGRTHFTAKFKHQLTSKFSHQLKAEFSHTPYGSSHYKSFWNQTPSRLMYYEARYSPFRDLELQTAIRYRSSTNWAEFSSIDGENFRSFNTQFPYSYGTFRNTIPAHVNIDITAAKWFWEQRFRALVKVKNMLNKKFYTHPLGVREGLAFLLKAEVRF